MIYLGADHGGYDLKEKIKAWLTAWGYQWEDCGNTRLEKDDDYPQFALAVGTKVCQEEAMGLYYPTPWKNRPKGILLCTSSAGVIIAANKVRGVRAANLTDATSAKHAREHNDANVIGLSGAWLTEEKMQEAVRTFLETEFSGEERHVRRLKQIEEYERNQDVHKS